jgi:hypothetical protein
MSIDQKLMCPIQFLPLFFSWTFPIAYSEAKKKSSGDIASPGVGSF